MDLVVLLVMLIIIASLELKAYKSRMQCLHHDQPCLQLELSACLPLGIQVPFLMPGIAVFSLFCSTQWLDNEGTRLSALQFLNCKDVNYVQQKMIIKASCNIAAVAGATLIKWVDYN